MQTLKKILFFLSPSERKKALLLVIMMLIVGFLDMIGVASILPFMAVLTNPSIIETNSILNSMYEFSNIFGVNSTQEFLFALGILVFLLLITSLSFKALTTWVQLRFVAMREYSIGKRLIEGYLYQPYSWFLNRHSADIGKLVLSQVTQVIGDGMSPFFQMIAQIIVSLALIILIFITDPKLSLIILITLGLAYGLVYKVIKKILSRIGKERLIADKSRFKIVSEAFGAAKEVKVGGLEENYIKRFNDPAKIFAYNTSTAQIITQLPRYILEIIAFGGILLVILYTMSKNDNFTTALPLISLYAFAGYRLLPALQKIYSAVTQLRFVSPALDNLYDELRAIKIPNSTKIKDSLLFNKMISLKNVSFSYPDVSRKTLDNINLNIPIYSSTGFVGVTGSGKTTVIDIILGLLETQQGTLEVDGKIITKNNIRAWQDCIGYVPQSIFLSDDTIAANIAFGIDKQDINLKAVENAAKLANLHEFVTKELSKKYQTVVGERGIRLSGGQRQRIGVARALYHEPQLLVFDEATSALDNQTEKEVMNSLRNLRKKITTILIAHRLDTIKHCDNIFIIKNGKLISEGKYDNLIKESLIFKKLAQAELEK